jgi:hypothetical protein
MPEWEARPCCCADWISAAGTKINHLSVAKTDDVQQDALRVGGGGFATHPATDERIRDVRAMR